MTTNHYLEGEFAPLHEEYTLTGLDVEGTIPEHLDGRPAKRPQSDRRNRSRALPLVQRSSLVHGLRIRHGKAK